MYRIEPFSLQMHYLLYENGFQTWEYSPAYAIRSYAYLWIHALPLKLYTQLLFVPKVCNKSKIASQIFICCLQQLFSAQYIVQLWNGLFCAICHTCYLIQMFQFYILRCLLGCICTACELYFYRQALSSENSEEHHYS